MAVIIHDLAEARTAIADGPSAIVEMVTAPGLVARAGIPWIRFVVDQLQQEFPDHPFVLAVDCDQDAARVMEAIRAGLGPIHYAGPQARWQKLQQMAAGAGITLLSGLQDGQTSFNEPDV